MSILAKKWSSLVISFLLHLVIFAIIYLSFLLSPVRETEKEHIVSVDIVEMPEVTRQAVEGKKLQKNIQELQEKSKTIRNDLEKILEKNKGQSQKVEDPIPPKSDVPPLPKKEQSDVVPEIRSEKEMPVRFEEKASSVLQPAEKQTVDSKVKSGKQPEDKSTDSSPLPKLDSDTDNIGKSNSPGSGSDQIASLLKGTQGIGAKQILFSSDPSKTSPDSEEGANSVRGEGEPGESVISHMMSNELVDLRNQIQRCWKLPPEIQGAPDIAVRLQVVLGRDGRLLSRPQLLSSGSGAVFQAAVESAFRAVLNCQPYRLAEDKYEIWQSVTVNFNPRLMNREQ